MNVCRRQGGPSGNGLALRLGKKVPEWKRGDLGTEEKKKKISGRHGAENSRGMGSLTEKETPPHGSTPIHSQGTGKQKKP